MIDDFICHISNSVYLLNKLFRLCTLQCLNNFIRFTGCIVGLGVILEPVSSLDRSGD